MDTRHARGQAVCAGLLVFALTLLSGATSLAAPAETGISVSPISGSFYLNPADSGSFSAGPATGVTFVQDFPSLNFNPPAGVVPCSNQTGVTTTTHPFTNVVQQPDGTCKTLPAQGSGKQAGAGDMESFQAVFTGSFVISAEARVTFGLYSDDGWILSIGPSSSGAQPAFVSGPMLNFPKSGPFNGYPIVGSYNVVSAPNQNNLVVNFPSSGTYPFELDYSECCDGDLALTVTANGAPIPPVSPLALDVKGLANAAQVRGAQHIEVAATSGQAQKVDLLVDGRAVGSSTTAPFAFDWDTSKETPGQHKVTLRGTDASGATVDKDLTVNVVAAAAPTTAAPPTPVPVATAVAAPVPQPAQSSNTLLIVAIALVLLLALIAVGLFFYLRRPKPEPEPVPVPVVAEPVPVVEEKTEFIGRGAFSDLTMVSTRRPVAPPKAKLLIKPDREIQLSRTGETVIGRDAANAAVVDDRQASRHHARVILRDGDFWIEDLNSTNGTRVNGIRVEKQKLTDNDQIGVGDSIITFTVEPV